MRPLSPSPLSPSSSTASSSDRYPSTTAPRRVCKSLAVHAEAHEGGMRATVYCRLSIPVETDAPRAFPLLSLTSLSRLVSHSTYPLPLTSSLSDSTTEAVAAAHALNLPLEADEDRATDGGGGRRRGSGLPSSSGGSETLSFKLIEEEGAVSILLEGCSRSLSPTSSNEGRVLSPLLTPGNGRFQDRRKSTGWTSGQVEKEERVEWILVLGLEVSFGRLQLPLFANSIALPLPLCLRNTLSLSLPSHPTWDLLVLPTLRTTPSSSPNLITGVFPSASLLDLRWTPSAPSAILVIPRAELDVKWGIGELGRGEVVIKGKVEVQWRGVKDKVLVEVRVGGGEGMAGGIWEVLSCEGEGVRGWEVRVVDDDHPRMEEETSTPTPRRRPPPATYGPRPPSFTSLFDTPPPIAPHIDKGVFARIKEPSLLRQAAPFDGNASVDMSFEAEGDTVQDDEPHYLSENGSSIFIQLDLSTILTPAALPSPNVYFTLTLSFPSITLSSLSASSPSSSLRLSLPSFSLPRATHEEVLVTVSAGLGARVELLTPPEMLDLTNPDSPLPAQGGKARWRTARDSDDPTKRHNALVEVEVSLPPSRPTSLIVFSPPPSPTRTRTPSSLRSRPSRLSLAPPTTLSRLCLRLTPVPPLAPHLPWRIFTHLVFAHSFVGSFDLPLQGEQSVEMIGAWEVGGGSVGCESEVWDRKGERRHVRVECVGVKECFFVVSERVGEGGRVAVGGVLPRLPLGVAGMEVEVLALAGWELRAEKHAFDSATPVVRGASTTFSRFSIPPLDISHLAIHLERIPTSAPNEATALKRPTSLRPRFGSSAFLFVFLLIILPSCLSFWLTLALSGVYSLHVWDASSPPISAILFATSTSSRPPLPLPTFIDTFPPLPPPTTLPANEGSQALALATSFDFRRWLSPMQLGLRGGELVRKVLRFLHIL